MARVPSPKVGTSKTPSGPFQRTVCASARAASKATMLAGPDVHRRPRVGDLRGRHDLVLGAAGDLLGHDDVGRQHEGHALRLGRVQDALGVLDAVTLEQALADGVALGHEERVGHAAADDEGVDPVHEVLEDPHLVRDLGAADDGRERAWPATRAGAESAMISRSMSRPA